MQASAARGAQRVTAPTARHTPAPARRVAGRVHRGGTADSATPLGINVHGRHVDVTPEIDSAVRAKLAALLDKFRGAQILESEGGVAFVDVRLMNSQAEVKLMPRVANRRAGEEDQYIRQGELKVCESGDGWEASLDNALAALDRKLHKYTKPAPRKVDYRRL